MNVGSRHSSAGTRLMAIISACLAIVISAGLSLLDPSPAHGSPAVIQGIIKVYDPANARHNETLWRHLSSLRAIYRSKPNAVPKTVINGFQAFRKARVLDDVDETLRSILKDKEVPRSLKTLFRKKFKGVFSTGSWGGRDPLKPFTIFSDTDFTIVTKNKRVRRVFIKRYYRHVGRKLGLKSEKEVIQFLDLNCYHLFKSKAPGAYRSGGGRVFSQIYSVKTGKYYRWGSGGLSRTGTKVENAFIDLGAKIPRLTRAKAVQYAAELSKTIGKLKRGFNNCYNTGLRNFAKQVKRQYYARSVAGGRVWNWGAAIKKPFFAKIDALANGLSPRLILKDRINQLVKGGLSRRRAAKRAAKEFADEAVEYLLTGAEKTALDYMKRVPPQKIGRFKKLLAKFKMQHVFNLATGAFVAWDLYTNYEKDGLPGLAVALVKNGIYLSTSAPLTLLIGEILIVEPAWLVSKDLFFYSYDVYAQAIRSADARQKAILHHIFDIKAQDDQAVRDQKVISKMLSLKSDRLRTFDQWAKDGWDEVGKAYVNAYGGRAIWAERTVKEKLTLELTKIFGAAVRADKMRKKKMFLAQGVIERQARHERKLAETQPWLYYLDESGTVCESELLALPAELEGAEFSNATELAATTVSLTTGGGQPAQSRSSRTGTLRTDIIDTVNLDCALKGASRSGSARYGYMLTMRSSIGELDLDDANLGKEIGALKLVTEQSSFLGGAGTYPGAMPSRLKIRFKSVRAPFYERSLNKSFDLKSVEAGPNSEGSEGPQVNLEIPIVYRNKVTNLNADNNKIIIEGEIEHAGYFGKDRRLNDCIISRAGDRPWEFRLVHAIEAARDGN